MELDIYRFRRFFKNHARYRGIPPVAIATTLSILPHIGTRDYSNWIGYQSVNIFLNIGIISILILSVLAYLRLLYEKEWLGYRPKNRLRRYFHYFSFAFIGVSAAFIPYIFGIMNLIFELLNQETNGEINIYLPYLWLYAVAMSFIVTDIFNSLDGKSGILFKMPKRNPLPLKNYSSLDYKLDRLFGLN